MAHITRSTYKTVLAIAGSDSGGCAGIQADIKSISANGAFATTAITAITAQNTMGVQHIAPVSVESIVHQIHSVLDDIHIDAIKIGMLHAPEVIKAVQNTLEPYGVSNVVLDPVMVATSGDRLIHDDAIDTLKQFLPCAILITPNIPEATILLNGADIERETMPDMARAIGKTYRTSVLLKGGHINVQHDKTVTDILYAYPEDTTMPLVSEYVHTNNTHGTGCSLSSAITAYLAQGNPLQKAVILAKHYISKAIQAGKNKTLGHGAGPIHHFYHLTYKM